MQVSWIDYLQNNLGQFLNCTCKKVDDGSNI